MTSQFPKVRSPSNWWRATNADDRLTIFSVVAGSAVALLILYTAPVIVGAYVRTLGLSEQIAGLMFSLELLGFTFGALIMFAIVSVNRRHVLTVAVVIMVQSLHENTEPNLLLGRTAR